MASDEMMIIRLTRLAMWAGDTVTEICVGSGPCGELRYPACEFHVAHSRLACF